MPDFVAKAVREIDVDFRETFSKPQSRQH